MRDGVIRAAVGLAAVVVASVAVGRLLRSHRPGAPGITIGGDVWPPVPVNPDKRA